jgi:hypothetical protein
MEFTPTPKHKSPTVPVVPSKVDKARRKRRASHAPEREGPSMTQLLRVAAGTAVPLPQPPPDFKRLKMENCPDAAVGFTSLLQFIEFVEHNKLSDNYVHLRKAVPVLKELDAMVGMSTLKLQIIHQVIYHITGNSTFKRFKCFAC